MTENTEERLESLVERQQRTLDEQTEVIEEQTGVIEEQSDTIADLERQLEDAHGGDVPVSRRSVLKAGGALGALGLGVGTASADPTGQVGTGSRPIETLYADGLSGPLTGGEELDSLVGDGLIVQNNELTSTAAGLDTPTLSIDSIDVADTFETESFSVGIKVEETEGLLTDDLEVTLEVSGSDDDEYNETIDATELQQESATVTFGEDDGTEELGSFDPGDYTVTATADARNAPATTASDEFSVAPVEFAGGDGTEQDPYQIETWHHLHDVRAVPDRKSVLVADLDENTAGYGGDGENGVVLDADGDPVDGNGFDPIGTDSDRFTGTFDGNDHTITGLTIDRSDDDDVGLFGVAGSGAIIENVGLEAVDVSGTNYVGGLVGHSLGTVERSYTTGSVSGDRRVGGLVGFNNYGAVSTSYATGSVSGGSRVGGLVGHNNGGTVSSSYATGSVSGDSSVGGLVGDNYEGTVERSYATGSVSGDSEVGGFVGFNYGTVERSYATGSVSGNYPRGLVGYNEGNVSTSYWDVPATGQDSSWGGTGIGSLSDDPPAAGMVGDDLNDGLESDFDFTDTWETVDAENDSDVSEDDYPVLRALDRATQLEARA